MEIIDQTVRMLVMKIFEECCTIIVFIISVISEKTDYKKT